MTAKAFLLSEVSPGSDRLVYYSPLQPELRGMNTAKTKPVCDCGEKKDWGKQEEWKKGVLDLTCQSVTLSIF